MRTPYFFFFTLVIGCAGGSSAAIDDPLTLTMLPIAGGEFMMGDVIEEDHPDALPLHRVTIQPFRISKYETTYEQYDAFASATGRPLPPDDGHGRGRRAVVYVSWIFHACRPLPKNLEQPGFRITRGGSFAASGDPPQPALTTRTYWRAGTLDEVESFAIGFRCAK